MRQNPPLPVCGSSWLGICIYVVHIMYCIVYTLALVAHNAHFINV